MGLLWEWSVWLPPRCLKEARVKHFGSWWFGADSRPLSLLPLDPFRRSQRRRWPTSANARCEYCGPIEWEWRDLPLHFCSQKPKRSMTFRCRSSTRLRIAYFWDEGTARLLPSGTLYQPAATSSQICCLNPSVADVLSYALKHYSDFVLPAMHTNNQISFRTSLIEHKLTSFHM